MYFCLSKALGALNFMKKILPVLFIFFGCSLHAQIKGFVGVKGGGQLSSAYIEHTLFDYFTDIEPIPGYHAGVTGKIFTNKRSNGLNAGLQISALYMQKGWKQQFPTEEPDYVSEMNYLEIPAEAVIYGGRGKVKLFFTLGMYLEYLLNLHQDPNPDTDNIGFADFYTYEENRDKKLGYGGRGSLGIWYESSVGTFQLEGFFTFSISNMIDYGSFDTRIPDLSNHFAGGVSVSYLIPFGKMDF